MPHDSQPDDGTRPTPEEQTAAFKQRIPDWERFAADIQASDHELEEWRAAGKPGFPPGAISARDYLKQRVARSHSE